MGIDFTSLHYLAPFIRMPASPSARVLSLGKQDLWFTYSELVEFLQQHRMPFVPVPSERIATTDSFAWVAHEDWEKFRHNLHQRTLFEMLGFDPAKVETLDVDDYETAEILHDLNQPVPDRLVGCYDLVLDLGTLEHLFDVKQAFFNFQRLLRVGGLIVHMNPVTVINHGFINVNADLYRDFYSSNGFVELALNYVALPPRGPKPHYWMIDPAQVQEPVPGYTLVSLAVYRKEQEQPSVVPRQGFYTSLHHSWDHQTRPVPGAAPAPKKPDDWTFSLAAVARQAMEKVRRKLRPERPPGTLVRL
jgi:hypothetical protein